MTSWIDHIHWESISVVYIWIFVFGSQFLENVFPPYPGDTILVLSGVLVGLGYLSIWSCILAVYLGNITGALLMFYYGSHILDFMLTRFKNRFVQSLNLENFHAKIENWFSRYGVFTIVMSRFIATIRFFVTIVAGMSKMKFIYFFTAYSISSILWSGLLVSGGYMLGQNKELIFYYLKVYNIIIMFIVFLFLFVYVLYKFLKKKKFI